MKVTYDPEADALYIYLSKGKKSTKTEEISDGFLVDYADRELIGIEILDASKKLPKKNLESAASLPHSSYRAKITRTV